MFRKQAAEAQASVASAATAINVEMGEALRDLAQEDDAGWHGDWCPWRRWRGGGGTSVGPNGPRTNEKPAPRDLPLSSDCGGGVNRPCRPPRFVSALPEYLPQRFRALRGRLAASQIPPGSTVPPRLGFSVRMVKSRKIRAPSLHLGPHKARWDKDEIDRRMRGADSLAVGAGAANPHRVFAVHVHECRPGAAFW